MTTRFQKFMDDCEEWYRPTFGIMQNSIAVTAHLRKEVMELSDAIHASHATKPRIIEGIKEELSDCFMLITEIANLEGFSAEQLLDIAFEKLETNKKRSWGSPDKDGSIQHIKE